MDSDEEEKEFAVEEREDGKSEMDVDGDDIEGIVHLSKEN